jgi:hypothetical protein
MARKNGDKKGKGGDKARRKYKKPTFKLHGSISGLSEKVVGMMLAG